MFGVDGSVDVSFSVDSEPPLPTADTVATLIKLRRMKMWHMRMEDLVRARLKGLQGASAEKEYQCKKIVALCTGLPIDKVEDVSDISLQLYNANFIARCSRIWSLQSRVNHRLLI